MKKLILVFFVVCVFSSCVSTPPAEGNPKAAPELTVGIPELFSPNPDITDDTLKISIAVKHPVGIKDWNISIQPIRQGSGQSQAAQSQTAQSETRQRSSDEQRQRQPFFLLTGTGTPPAQWEWNGRSTRPSGELVQSATDYKFTLTVNDIYNNSAVHEGVISVDVLVRREGNNLRIIVPSIIFPPDSSDMSRVSEDDQRSNRRVLRLIANALNKYPNYRITIEGHANPLSAAGTADWRRQENTYQPLSEQRARAVGEYLAANHNIARTRFTYVGIGTTRPVADYTDEEEQWKNRRVEFILVR